MKRSNISIRIPEFAGELAVDYTYSEGRPAVMYLRNGDPGYPAEPSEIVDVAVCIGDSSDISELLSEEAMDKIYEAIDNYEAAHKYDGLVEE